MNDKTNNYGDKENARQLRRDMTAAEVSMWQYLRNGATGFRFRRQHPIGPYVLDFYSYELNLCIELDGDAHKMVGADIHDMIRTDYLNSQNITVLRYLNEVVFTNIDAILETIKNYAQNPVLMPGWHLNEFIQPPHAENISPKDKGGDPL